MTSRILTLLTTGGLLLAGALGAPTASAQSRPDPAAGSLAVTGTVATPTTYTASQLAVLSQTTLPDLRDPRRTGRQVTGALLEPLVNASSPILPDTKNAALRVTVTITGAHHRRLAVALAELDPNNGDHPALLVPTRDQHADDSGVELVFPGDLGYSRTIQHVSRIDVAVAAPAVPAGVPAGGLRIVDGRRTVTLSAARLAALPAVSRTVRFQSGKGPQDHLETGPTLAKVLKAAHVKTDAGTTVAAIADDGYVATVTPAEAKAGRRPLLLSLVEDEVPLDQPRLVPDGDVFGARYVNGVLELQVG